MTLLTLQNDGVDLSWAMALAASLPASLRLVDQGGDMVLVSGRGDWPARLLALIEAAHRRLIVIDPQACAIGQDTIARIESTGARIMLCETHADNPAVAQFRADATGDYAAATITGQGAAAIANLVLQQLRLARGAGFAPGMIVHAVGDEDCAVATVQADFGDGQVPLRLTAARTRTGGHHRLLTHGRMASSGLQVWTDPASRPATAFHISADRTIEQPTIYESAHRASLRLVLASSDAFLGNGGLQAWAHDASLAMTIASAF